MILESRLDPKHRESRKSRLQLSHRPELFPAVYRRSRSDCADGLRRTQARPRAKIPFPEGGSLQPNGICETHRVNALRNNRGVDTTRHLVGDLHSLAVPHAFPGPMRSGSESPSCVWVQPPSLGVELAPNDIGLRSSVGTL